MKIIVILIHIIILFVSCNIEIPVAKELKTKSTLDHDVNKIILQSDGLFTQEYSIYPNVTVSYHNGEKTTANYIFFSCISENLNNLKTSEVDSVCIVLAKAILVNIENDTSFTHVIIEMKKEENTIFTQKSWNYSRDFEISELKK